MPILKQLVNNSNQSKRRSRADLTAEMISAPLGDFRHTMHVGRGGDAFGDTSFLSTRSGEPPKEPEPKHGSPGPKPGLLARTFRGSKRSQSVNRGDKYDYNAMGSSTGSSQFVKNAISMPYLNDEGTNRGSTLPKSVSSSPMKTLTEADTKPANGAAAVATLDPEFDERNFGELTDLPPSMPRGNGMKHAESMMSFHIDLGPSMLGDILSVMEKKGWEDDDLGYEEGKGSEGHGSPSTIPHIDDEDEDAAVERPPARPPRSVDQRAAAVDPYTPELHARGSRHRHADSCSLSSSGSGADDKPLYQLHDADTDSAKYSSPRGDDDRDFTFMDEDEDDDEIRV
ncbi:cdc42 effector protein 4 [Salarias fasciatus]|uniref:CRIB domain-containing protein n=1 Tax=Salarias fasciatus TaxID=181472 RepID=A0A672F3S3_SALFA|nr:cdc42 effector protein 4 [Salarias fasciatus]